MNKERRRGLAKKINNFDPRSPRCFLRIQGNMKQVEYYI